MTLISLFYLQLEDDEEKKKTRRIDNVIQKGQSKLFTKLPPPKNSRHEPIIQDTSKSIEKPVVKKSAPLVPQSVSRKQAPKKDSDDEDESAGSFFTMDEPALKPSAEPMDIGPIYPTVSTYHQEEAVVYSGMPTNQQYNMAGIYDTEMSYATTGDAGLELDDIAVCTIVFGT